MSKAIFLKAIPLCLLLAPFFNQQRASAADTDVFVSTNAGFAPYLLQAELQPGNGDRFFGLAASISAGRAAILIQEDFGDINGKLAFFDEAADGSRWMTSDLATVYNGISVSEGPSDYQSCFSVASDGDDVVLAEPRMTVLESNSGQGGVSFFRRSTSHWDYVGLVVDPIPDEGQFFGCSVAISGATAVIGAPWASRGAIFIANFDGKVWSIVQKVTPPTDSPNYFGSTVGISGDRIVVGAPGDGPYGVDTRAIAYVLDRLNGSWRISAAIAPSDAKVGDDFAHAVAVDGDTIVVGARSKNSGGAVYIYQLVDSSWQLAREFQEVAVSGRNPDFGFSLSVKDGLLLVGELGLARAHLFQRKGVQWLSRSTFSTESIDTQFGFSVALSDRELIVGAPNKAGGRAYIFRDDQIWANDFE